MASHATVAPNQQRRRRPFRVDLLSQFPLAVEKDCYAFRDLELFPIFLQAARRHYHHINFAGKGRMPFNDFRHQCLARCAVRADEEYKDGSSDSKQVSTSK